MDDYFADDNLTYSELEDDYIPNGNVVYIEDIGEHVSETYAERNFTYCELLGEWYDDTVESDLQGHIPTSDSIQVYTDIDENEEDWRFDYLSAGGGYRYRRYNTFFKYINRDRETKYFDNDLKYEFVNVVIDENGNTVLLKREGDEDLYFKYRGVYYHNKIKDSVTGQLRLWENEK